MQGRKVADSSKQATLEDSGMTLQITEDDTEEHFMSLGVVQVIFPC